MVTIPPLVSGYGVVQQRVHSDASSHSGQGAAAPAAPPAPTDPLLALLDATLKSAAVRQNGLAPLYADLTALAARPDLPPGLRAAVEAVLGLQLPTGALGAHTLQIAVARSGLFLESALASGQMGAPDLKATLINLRAVLQSFLGAEPEASVRPAPPPPYPGAPPAGQPPSPATAGVLPLKAAAAQVLSDTDAALNRQTMLQVASLPDARAPDHPHRLALEIPLLTPQGTAVVALQVERDAHRTPGEEDHPPVWRIGFSVHLDPAGPIHARITQTGPHTNVSIVAERIASAQALHQGLPLLQAMLAEAALEPGELNCRLGAQEKGTAAPGRLLDRAT